MHAAIATSRLLAWLYRNSILPQAEAAAASALVAYRAGAVDFMTVVEDRMTVNRYRQELVALDAAQAIAWIELEMLLDRPLLLAADRRGGA
jgi:outer membrane protein TolC